MAIRLRSDTISEGRWIRIDAIHWQDRFGCQRVWESVSRNRESDSGASAVAVLAFERQPLSMILVRQYRPPLDSYTLEMPAGLIDSGESAASAGIRELKEETGYSVLQDLGCSTATCLDPGLSSEKIITQHVVVGQAGTQELDEGEDVQVVCLPIWRDLRGSLLELLADLGNDTIVFGELEALLKGLDLGLNSSGHEGDVTEEEVDRIIARISSWSN